MTERTIRQNLREAAAGFSTLDAAVFTSFNFNPEFFESNVLPALFGIDTQREGARKNEVNAHLLQTEVCALYDASTRPSGGGPYLYQRIGVFRPGALFHPKLAILAGTHIDDNRPWIYLAVASANLTRAAWGKNQEVVAEAWIGSNRQTLFGELKETLEWLRDQAPEARRTAIPAIERCLAVMDSFGGGLNIDASSGVSFYFSPLHEDGFLPFLRAGQTARWDRLQVFSPFWGDVPHHLRDANTRSAELIPALLDNGTYGLGRQGLEESDGLELSKIPRMEEYRFWHAKTYILTRGDRTRVGVGSANFTGAGLRGGTDGNVEAMLVYETDAREIDAFLPKLSRLKLDDPSLPDKNVDEGPKPAELVIDVVFDWKAREYRLFFTPATLTDTGGYRLALPGLESISLDGVNGPFALRDERGPVLGSTFRLHYERRGERMTFDGLINEINVHLGDKPYFRTLTLAEILESWRLPADSLPLSGDSSDDPDETEGDAAPTSESSSAAQPETDPFDLLNLYELYRGFYGLRRRMQQAIDDQDDTRLVGLLAQRPDSVYRLAKQAGEDPDEHVLPRYFVLLECRDVMAEMRRHVPGLDKVFREDIERWLAVVRARVRELPREALGGLPFDEAMKWFENELKQAWRT